MISGKKNQLLKILLLGESHTGKTALMEKICFPQKPFKPNYRPTIGADFLSREIDDKTLQVWDTAGQEKFTSLGSAFYRGTDEAIFVYAINDKASFEKGASHIQEGVANAHNPKLQLLIIGNKLDLSN